MGNIMSSLGGTDHWVCRIGLFFEKKGPGSLADDSPGSACGVSAVMEMVVRGSIFRPTTALLSRLRYTSGRAPQNSIEP
jgi:hypothetical protein